jgi:hypothetical protein
MISIGGSAFYYCSSLVSITLKSTTPPVVGSNGLYNVNRTKCKLVVPKNTKAVYAVSSPWSEFLLISEDLTNAVENPEINESKVFGHNGQLVIENQTIGLPVQIYSLSGALLRSFKTNDIHIAVDVPAGAYVVRCGSKTTKVIL